LEVFGCLIDLRYDRHDGHASSKGEGKDHGHKYHFHWIIHLIAALCAGCDGRYSDLECDDAALLLSV
jgi:hypothetical protein